MINIQLPGHEQETTMICSGKMITFQQGTNYVSIKNMHLPTIIGRLIQAQAKYEIEVEIARHVRDFTC